MRRAVTAGALALLLSLVGLAFAGPAAAADAAAEQRFIDLINAERTARGLVPMVLRPEVTPVARTWTAAMIATGVLSHNPLMAEQMPSDWVRVGENVGVGGGVDALHAAFMNSPSHRANVLGDFNQVGVGVDRDLTGRMWATVNFLKAGVQAAAPTAAPAPTAGAATAPAAVGSGTSAPGACRPNANPPALAPTGATGYYVLGADGAIFNYGNAPYKGSVPDHGLRISAVLMTLTPSYDGYWIAGSDGGIFSFGDAQFHGSVPGLRLGAAVSAIDLKPTKSGNGYWILGADGGIFSFGDAQFHGSLPGVGVRNRAVRLIPTATGNGYWILGADGGIFSFGDAGYFGSVPGLGLCEALNGVQLSTSVGGNGYYVVSDRGRVFAFGDAPFLGEPAAAGAITRDIAAVRR